MSNFFDKLTVRHLTKDDLDSIVEIDTKVLGEARREYWVTKTIKEADTRRQMLHLYPKSMARLLVSFSVRSWINSKSPTTSVDRHHGH